MKLICCIDERGGMCFNRRRQSRDRAVRADILAMAQGHTLWMNAATRRQFTEAEAEISVDEEFLEKALPGEFCFVETPPLAPWLPRAEALILYRWDRVYPADGGLDVDPAGEGWTLLERREFPGHSHKTITKEVYIP